MLFQSLSRHHNITGLFQLSYLLCSLGLSNNLYDFLIGEYSKNDKMFVFKNKMAYQRPNYSNIKGTVAAYLD
jgi:hypothetical protein